jgi:hypothetical protein
VICASSTPDKKPVPSVIIENFVLSEWVGVAASIDDLFTINNHSYQPQNKSIYNSNIQGDL